VRATRHSCPPRQARLILAHLEIYVTSKHRSWLYHAALEDADLERGYLSRPVGDLAIVALQTDTPT
jgi:hypothetical protein